MDTFEEDVLAVQIETIRGPIIILTAYQPPRYPYLPKDLLKFRRKPIPVYCLGDLNVIHINFGEF